MHGRQAALSSPKGSVMSGPARLGFATVVSGRRSKWIVLGVWLLLLVAGGSLGSRIGSVQNNDAETWLPSNAESTQALRVAQQYFTDKGTSQAVVVYARAGGLTEADRTKVRQDRESLARLAAGPMGPVVTSQDGAAMLFTAPLRQSTSDNSVLGGEVDRALEIVQRAAPTGLNVRITGAAGNASDFIHIFSGFNTTLLVVTVVVVAIFLLATYRSPSLWIVPLVAVAAASQLANAVVYLLARYAGLLVNGQSSFLLTVLVFGVGTDYALLLVARYREELRRHADRHAAMRTALSRSLPTITASAATVVLAMLCLAAGRMNSTRGLGPVAAVGVTVVFLAMVTLLPAVLVTLGRWVFWPFVPRHDPVEATTSRPDQSRIWSWVARLVGRSHRPVWILSALVLAALAFGTTTLTTGQTQADQFTKQVDSVAGQQLLAAHFPAGSSAPADIYVTSDPSAALAAIRRVPGVSAAQVAGQAAGWTHITAVLADPPDAQTAQQTVTRLRDTLRQVPQAAGLVGGQSAISLDTAAARADEEMLLIPLALAVILLMLILLLRAIMAPVLLLASIVLSYGAAVGAAVVLFRALGYPRIDRSLLLIGFIFLAALGVDYTIFLMSRAREEVLRRGHDSGVLAGLTVTGGVITSAGLVLAATFCVLAVLPVVQTLQQGLLVAVGVLLDTFIVRTLLVPAMALDIGPRYWWPSSIGTPAQPRQADARQAETTVAT
jgi:putative drug exporter of the RND superfamily